MFQNTGEWEEKDVKKNFYRNLMDGSLFALAINFVSLTTIMPVYIKKIGGSNISVGLIPVIWTLGVNFPQILIANHARRQPYKLRLVKVTAVYQRLPWLLLAILASFVITNTSPEISLLLFFTGFSMAAFGTGFNLPGWFDLVAKVTPVNLRGRLFAFRVTLGAIFGMAAGFVAKVVIDEVVYPYNFGLLFLLAFLFMAVSYVYLININEQTENKDVKVVKYWFFLKELPQILRDNKNYRNFIIADIFMIISMMAQGFFTIDAIEKFSLPESYAGLFTVIMMFSMVLGSVLFGYVADRTGHKISMLFGALFMLAASLVAISVKAIALYYPVFAFAAFTVALSQVSRLSIIAEVCGEKDRSLYVSLSNLIIVPFTLFGALAGWLANRFGFETVFIISAVSAALSAFWFYFMVHEPRTLNNKGTTG